MDHHQLYARSAKLYRRKKVTGHADTCRCSNCHMHMEWSANCTEVTVDLETCDITLTVDMVNTSRPLSPNVSYELHATGEGHPRGFMEYTFIITRVYLQGDRELSHDDAWGHLSDIRLHRGRYPELQRAWTATPWEKLHALSDSTHKVIRGLLYEDLIPTQEVLRDVMNDPKVPVELWDALNAVPTIGDVLAVDISANPCGDIPL